MFANFGTPNATPTIGNQTNNLSASSPFATAMQKNNQNTSGGLFQSPNQASFLGSNSTPSIFGNTNTSTNVPRSTQPFGFSQTTGFGSNTFGAAPSAFTATSTLGGFNQPQKTTQSSSLFGQTSTQPSLFAQKPATSFGAFGTGSTSQTNTFQQPQSLFGTTSSTASRPDSLFSHAQSNTNSWGATQNVAMTTGGGPISLGPGPSTFGSNVVSSAPSFSLGGFNQQTTASNSLFGSQPTQNTFQQPSNSMNNSFAYPKPTFNTAASTASTNLIATGGGPSFNNTNSIFGNTAAATTQAPSFNQFNTTSTFPLSNTGIQGANTNTNFGTGATSLFGAPAASNPSNTVFGQSSAFGSNQPINNSTVFGVSQPEKQNIFGQNNQMTYSVPPATSSIFSQQPSLSAFVQPPSNTFGVTAQPQFGGYNQNFGANNATTMNAQTPFQPGVTNPMMQQNPVVTINQPESIISILNKGIDKDVDILGYKSLVTRLGDFNYYNTDYRVSPNTKDVSEQAVRIIGSGNADYNPAPLHSLTTLNYSSDLKLGNVINANGDVELPDPPLDTITKLRFSSYNPELIAAASWDSSIRVWKRQETLKYVSTGCKNNVTGVVFDIAWTLNDNLAMACSDGSVILLDVLTNQKTIIGRHSGPVKAIAVCDIEKRNGIISGSWDSTIKCWDPRSKTCASTVQLDGKVINLACKGSSLVILTNNYSVKLYTCTGSPIQEFKKFSIASTSPLRCVSIHTMNSPTRRGTVAAGTTGGRIYIESYMSSSNTGTTNFTYRCHRISKPNLPDIQYAYPVHDMCFHPTQNVLASAGGDGTVAFWDITSKSTNNLNRSSLPVTSLSFSSDGKALAYAVGYDWAKGIMSYNYSAMKPAIFVRKIEDKIFGNSNKYNSSNM